MDAERQKELEQQFEELEAQLEELENPLGAPAPEKLVHLPLYQPDGFDAVGSLADRIEAGEAFLLDVEGLDRYAARRIIDFLSGAVYLAHGRICLLSRNIYVITPPGF